jgi:D-alanyl-D-alanine carboxypeptidase
MNLIKLILLTSLMSMGIAQAEDTYAPSFEDTPEFLTDPNADMKVLAPAETWAYKFELIRTNGTSQVLSEDNENLLLKPASTVKIFTGWWAFQNKNRTDAYLGQMLKDSVNSMAEATVKRMGGVDARDEYYRDQGLDITDLTFISADGSGLSYSNQSTCQIQIDLLKKIKSDKNYTRFKKLLAQPKQTGTLKTRLTTLTGKVFAKTGTLAKTAALSGFIETKRGTVVFCVLSDYLTRSVTSARQKIDKMVKANYALVK